MHNYLLKALLIVKRQNHNLRQVPLSHGRLSFSTGLHNSRKSSKMDFSCTLSLDWVYVTGHQVVQGWAVVVELGTGFRCLRQ